MKDKTSSIPETVPSSDGKKLLLDFLSKYLGVKVTGVQGGFGYAPDCFLFEGPYGTTLAIPVSITLEDQATARAVIQEKLLIKQKAFECFEHSVSGRAGHAIA